MFTLHIYVYIVTTQNCDATQFASITLNTHFMSLKYIYTIGWVNIRGSVI
jgi:hypothetical protein